jgi:hypothetical protein
VEGALRSLPWVDKDSVKADITTHRVKFRVTDKGKYNLDEIKKALPARFQEVKPIAGPG